MSPSPYSAAKQTSEQLVAVLEEIVKELHPYQVAAAARRVRNLPGDTATKELFALADALESERGRRAVAAIRQSAGDEASEPVGVLDDVTAAAVTALPHSVRGAMFNAHGEPLVYSTDDVVYHGDADWQGYRVVDGSARGLVLDGSEQGFVRALWESAEEVRGAKRQAG